MKFIDEAEIAIRSGHGGKGALSFRREKFVPRGGPDGGDGGRGGDVIFRVNVQLGTLMDFRYKRSFSAEDGHQGSGSMCSGCDGKNIVIEVPAGTILKKEDGEVIADLSQPGRELVLLKGGRGGKGNAFFKTSVNQAPQFSQPGEAGESMTVSLELKLLADVGIVGYPNAGKSTLISKISAAKPKIADYPFTTLVPNLGVVSHGEGHSFVVADIPGLIPGAHEGTGLGIQFLKHIERTKCFIHLVDVSGYSGRDPIKDYADINHELKMYSEELSQRPQVVVLNKIDTAQDSDVQSLKREFEKKHNTHVYLASTITGYGLKEILNEVDKIIIEQKEGEEKDSRENFA